MVKMVVLVTKRTHGYEYRREVVVDQVSSEAYIASRSQFVRIREV